MTLLPYLLCFEFGGLSICYFGLTCLLESNKDRFVYFLGFDTFVGLASAQSGCSLLRASIENNWLGILCNFVCRILLIQQAFQRVTPLRVSPCQEFSLVLRPLFSLRLCFSHRLDNWVLWLGFMFFLLFFSFETTRRQFFAKNILAFKLFDSLRCHFKHIFGSNLLVRSLADVAGPFMRFLRQEFSFPFGGSHRPNR